MAWTDPRTFVSGEILNAGIFNTHVRDNLAFLKERVQAGTVNIVPVANTPTSATVTFPVPFSAAPRVIVSAHSIFVGTQVLGVGADSETTTTCRVTVTRTNTSTTTIRWVATLLDT